MNNHTKNVLATIMHLMKLGGEGRTTDYESLARLLGLPDTGSQLGRNISPILSKVFTWCQEHDLPPLTSLVVRKSGSDKGLPGKGFWELFSVYEASIETRTELLKYIHGAVYGYFKTYKPVFLNFPD